MATTSIKKQRQQQLMKKLEENPFLTDEELAKIFSVSVPTIRFDRAQLGVKEYRERIKNVAITANMRSHDFPVNNPMGELLDLNLFKDGLSVFTPDSSMTFDDSNVVRGCFIYSFAEMLATTVIGARTALVDVANIKYKRPVLAGSKLFAKSEVVRRRNNEYVVWVKIKANLTEVFRSKFILSVVD